MPKVNSFHGCFGRLKRDASKTTGIHSEEWTRVRGRKAFGMSEGEISKFLASKALRDAKAVRELAVAPKKSIPYLKTSCVLVGHTKEACQQGKQPHMKKSKMTEKVKQKIKSSLEPTIEEIEQEIQTNITELCKSENLLMKASKDLSIKMMRSKGLVEIQKKLYDRLLDLAVQRTTGLKHAPLIISAGKNPRKTLKKLPLMPKELEQYERILAGSEELEKLDDRFTDYLIYLEQIKKRRLELHRLNDYANYSEFKYVGPDGVLHRKPSANAKADTRYYKKVKSVRVSSPRTVGIRKHNNSKRVRHVELLGKSSSREHKKRETKIVPETERIQLKMTSPRLERIRQHVYDLQDEYWSAQQKIMPLTRELILQNNKPEQVKRCNQIRKTLCDLIDNTTWKQKLYERENAKLQKMLERRSYTRIERAFGAESSQRNVTDISNSYDQGPSEKSTVKLTTKEKL